MAARPKSPPSWFAALWLLIGVPFLIVGVRGLAVESSLRHELASGGETVVGTVIKKEIYRRDAFTRTYTIDFRYVTLDGHRLQSHAQLDEDVWYRLAELGPIPVRYLRAHPDRRAIAGEPDDSIMWWIFAGLGGLFSLIGVLLLAFSLRATLARRGAGPRKSPPRTSHAGLTPMSVPMGALRRAWRTPLFPWGLPFAAFGLLALGIAVQAAVRDAQYRLHAQHVTASVIDKVIRHAGSQDAKASQYLVRYRFIAADGSTQYGSREFPFDAWDALRAGAPLQVDYLPARSYESRLAGASKGIEILAWGLSGTILGGIGAALLIVPLRRARLIERLLRSGASADGTVEAVGPSSVTLRGVRVWRLDFSFIDGAGTRRAGQSGWLAPQAARAWKKGDTGPVRFDPVDSRRNIWMAWP